MDQFVGRKRPGGCSPTFLGERAKVYLDDVSRQVAVLEVIDEKVTTGVGSAAAAAVVDGRHLRPSARIAAAHQSAARARGS